MRLRKRFLIVIGSWSALCLTPGCGLDPDASQAWKSDLVNQHREVAKDNPEPTEIDPKKANKLPTELAPNPNVEVSEDREGKR